MCYNYYGDLAVARSLLKKQASSQPLNGSSEMRNRSQARRADRSNQQSSTKQILLDKEYSNLKHMLPSLNSRAKVSKLNLINEAVKYINELQEQVIQKLNADPQLIRQKILEEFDQKRSSSQNDSPRFNSASAISPVTASNADSPSLNASFVHSSHSSSQPISSPVQNRAQPLRAPMSKGVRRTPLEEISVQKSVKRQRV